MANCPLDGLRKRWPGAPSMVVITLPSCHRFVSTGAITGAASHSVFGGTDALRHHHVVLLHQPDRRLLPARPRWSSSKQRQGENCYVHHPRTTRATRTWFYTRHAAHDRSARAYDEEWLLHGDVDRPVYVVCKVTSVEEVAAIPGLKEIGRKNGFVFWMRDIP
jgi:hypothetical protein